MRRGRGHAGWSFSGKAVSEEFLICSTKAESNMKSLITADCWRLWAPTVAVWTNEALRINLPALFSLLQPSCLIPHH